MDDIKPQPGPQEQFLSSSADLVIYGGSAGGGKSWGLLLEPLRHVTTNPEFYATIFRRNTTQIRSQGGLWDESLKLYSMVDTAEPVETNLKWKFHGGGRVNFSHLEHEKTVYNYQGAQIPLIMFDELTHFSESQFFYMFSRNRSMCGVQPYIRATCNPDAESWVAKFIEWWIDGAGYAIPERCGIIRWFVRIKEKILWADSKKECIQLYGDTELPDDHDDQIKPKSFTFIRARLEDNPALTKADPNYKSNLKALPIVEQMRLLGGNWKVKYDSGLEIFPEDKLLVDGLPVPMPKHCDYILAILDTAVKSGVQHDGTGVIYCGYNPRLDYPLIVLDYDYVQIDGAYLETFIPSVFDKTQELAKQCGARLGVSTFIEDKQTGSVLLQQCQKHQREAKTIDEFNKWKTIAIPEQFAAMGKEGRAIDVSGLVFQGQVKFSEHAYNKTTTFKSETKNHLLYQVLNFRIGGKSGAHGLNAKQLENDDLLDTFCYAIQVALKKDKLK